MYALCILLVSVGDRRPCYRVWRSSGCVLVGGALVWRPDPEVELQAARYCRSQIADHPFGFSWCEQTIANVQFSFLNAMFRI